jgi:hypothetical protein
MDILSSLIFFVLVLASAGSHVYVAIKEKDSKILYIQIGIWGLVIAGGFFSIYHGADPSIAKILGVVIPQVN